MEACPEVEEGGVLWLVNWLIALIYWFNGNQRMMGSVQLMVNSKELVSILDRCGLQ